MEEFLDFRGTPLDGDERSGIEHESLVHAALSPLARFFCSAKARSSS
jgi:hypothetical protein